jgi:GNAT superfamily N-acetyltransferase
MHRIGRGNAAAAGAVLARAFIDDPGYVWIEPDRARRARYLGVIYGGLAKALCRLDETWALSADEASPNDVSGVAAWWPPGASVGIVQMIRAGLAELPFRCGVGTTVRTLTGLGALEKAHERVARGQPHWFLDHLGVDPSAQGKGLGRRLLREQLARVDGDRVPALLHTSKGSNVPFYGSLGFEVVEEQKVGGAGGFTLWTMRRPFTSA